MTDNFATNRLSRRDALRIAGEADDTFSADGGDGGGNADADSAETGSADGRQE